MKQYKGKVLKAMMMLLAVSFALAGTSTLSSCSSDDDPFFTVSEDDNPRILNTNLADLKLDRKTRLNLEIKVTPVHYTTVTWLLDGTQIYEGTTIDQTLPLGNHELKIVATTTKGKSTSRTLKVTVTPAADDPALGTNAIELWVAPGAETTIHKCKNLGTVTKVMVGGKEEWLEKLPPYQGGGEMIESVSFEKTTFEKLPFKFEAGTPDYVATHGLAKAIDYVSALGMDILNQLIALFLAAASNHKLGENVLVLDNLEGSHGSHATSANHKYSTHFLFLMLSV